MIDNRATSQQRATEVAQAGQTLGYWTVKTDHNKLSNTVVTPEGYQFYIIGGAWNKTTEVTITLDCLEDANGLKVALRDAGKYDSISPTASASASKSAELIAKDFSRRVIQKPETRELAQKMLDRLAEMQSMRVSLRGHVAQLEKIGYKFNRFANNETLRAEGYSSTLRPRNVKVSFSGVVTFEIDCKVNALTEIIKVLN